MLRAIIVAGSLIASALSAPTLIVAARGAAASQDIPDIAGTYELTRRVLANGTELRPPDIVALYGMRHGRGNLNLFVKGTDGTVASESTISRYTLTSTQYCEWIVYTTRNNLDHPGVTNEPPPVEDHCTRVAINGGHTIFAPPGEGGVETRYDKDGFVATVPGQFVDH